MPLLPRFGEQAPWGSLRERLPEHQWQVATPGWGEARCPLILFGQTNFYPKHSAPSQFTTKRQDEELETMTDLEEAERVRRPLTGRP
jgi:hypothetical protein